MFIEIIDFVSQMLVERLYKVHKHIISSLLIKRSKCTLHQHFLQEELKFIRAITYNIKYNNIRPDLIEVQPQFASCPTLPILKNEHRKTFSPNGLIL